VVLVGAQGEREPLGACLAELGHAVVGADDGLQALGVLQSVGADLVVLDLAAPDSFPALEKRRTTRSLREIPCLVLAPADATDHVGRAVDLGADDFLMKPVVPVLLQTKVEAFLETRRLREQEHAIQQQLEDERRRADSFIQVVIPVGIALTVEQDFNRLLERILLESKRLCNADAGTLYLRADDGHLRFTMMHTDSLNFAMGGTTGVEIPYPPIALYDPRTGEPNHHYVVTYTALTGRPVNIPDAYQAAGFDFSGTRAFDQGTGYRSTSFLVVPLKNASDQVIGVLQLINALDAQSGGVIPFDPRLQQMVESLAALAVVALEGYLRVQGLRQQIQELETELHEAKTR
jgi:DNA-binding response OmpR family regulator